MTVTEELGAAVRDYGMRVNEIASKYGRKDEEFNIALLATLCVVFNNFYGENAINSCINVLQTLNTVANKERLDLGYPRIFEVKVKL